MSYCLLDHLYDVVDGPEVVSSVVAQVAQLALLLQKSWHRIEGHATKLKSNKNFEHSFLEPSTEGKDSCGIDTDTPLSLAAALLDDAFIDPRDWIDSYKQVLLKERPTPLFADDHIGPINRLVGHPLAPFLTAPQLATA
jgi:hypothetical protein